MGKTPSGLVQGAARRATTSAWSPHPAFPQAPHSIRGSESKWAGLRHSCLGHREEGKIFSPDQLETTEEGSSSPLAGPRQQRLGPQGSQRGREVAAPSAVRSALVRGGLALGLSLASQKLEHLHGLELALLLTVRFRLSLEICSKGQRQSGREGGSTWRGRGSGQCH